MWTDNFFLNLIQSNKKKKKEMKNLQGLVWHVICNSQCQMDLDLIQRCGKWFYRFKKISQFETEFSLLYFCAIKGGL